MRTGENICKRKDGRWEARVPTGRNTKGQLTYKFLYGKTYREAKEKKLLWEKQNNSLQHKKKTTPQYLFRDIAKEWLAEFEPIWKPATYNKYVSCVRKYILPQWENKFIEDILQADYEHLIAGLKAGNHTAAIMTVNLILRGIAKYLQSTKQISFLFSTDTTIVRKSYKDMEPLTEAEWQTLVHNSLENLNSTNLGILISLYEGIRIGELCALRWENVDIDTQSLHICQTVQRLQAKNSESDCTRTILHFGPPKNGEIRIIPIHPFLCKILEKEKQGHDPKAFVLSGTDRVVEPRTFSNRFHKVLAHCHIRKVNVHLLRHSFASSCVEAGIDIKVLSEILGHKTVKITMDRYVHLSMQYKTKQLGLLAFSTDIRSQEKCQENAK